MSGLPTAEARTCDACGAAVTGQFCASCGTRFKGLGRASGWQAVASEYVGAEQPIGVLKAVWTVLRAPVRGPVALALDPTFRSHFVYFGMALSLAAFAHYVGLPRLMAYLLGRQVETSSELVTAEVALHYTLTAVFIPVSYLILASLSAVERRPYQYLKLWLVGSATGMLFQLACMIAIPAVLIAAGLVTALLGLGFQWIAYGWIVLHLAMWLCISAFAGLWAAQFWDLPRIWCIALFLAINVFIEEYLRGAGMIVIRQVLKFWP